MARDVDNMAPGMRQYGRLYYRRNGEKFVTYLRADSPFTMGPSATCDLVLTDIRPTGRFSALRE